MINIVTRFALIVDVLIRFLARTTLFIGTVFIIVLCLLSSVDAIGSRFLGVGVPSAIEFQSVLMGMIIFGGLASVQLDEKHIAVDTIIGHLSGRKRLLADIFALLCGSLLLLILASQSFEVLKRSFEFDERSLGLVGFPLFPIKAFVFFCLVIALVEFIRQIVRTVMRFVQADGVN